MGRRLTFIATLVGLLVSFLVSPKPAFANGLSVTYQPTPIAIAGDSYSVSATITATCSTFQEHCGQIAMTVYYQDAFGSEQSLTVYGTSSEQTWTTPVRTEILTAAIPADDVRFPSLVHRIVVRQNSCNGGFYGCSPDQHPNPPQPGFQTAIYSSPTYTVNVDNHLRLRFLTSSGSPAAGVQVVWGPLGKDLQTVWSVNADNEGRVNLALPETDPAVSSAAASKGYIEVFATAMTNVPTSPVPANTIDIRSVQVATVVASLPLGSPYVRARPSVQDRDITLQPESVPFSPPPGTVGTYAEPAQCTGGAAPPFGSFSYCSQVMETWHEWMPIASNVGADSGFTTKYTYSRSDSTTSSVRVKYSNTWFHSEGETTTRELNTASFFITKTSWNYFVDIDWVWERGKYTSCQFYSCVQWQAAQPRQWTGGNRSRDSGGSGPHGAARGSNATNPPGADCVIPIEDNFTVAKEDSAYNEIHLSGTADASLQGAAVTFTVHYTQTTSDSMSTGYMWAGTTTLTEPYLHVFTQNAWKGRTLYCPADSPDYTFTDRSNVAKGPYTPPYPG